MMSLHEFEQEQNHTTGPKNDVERMRSSDNGHVVDTSSGDALAQLKASSQQNLLVETSFRPQTPCDTGDSRIPLESLPPLPTPKNKIILQETVGGISLVLLVIIIFISLTHGVAMTAIGTVPPGTTSHTTFLLLIYGEALVATICLLGILFVDPGFIPRSPEACYPLPSSVEIWVRSLLDQQDKRKKASGGDNADDGQIVENDNAINNDTAERSNTAMIPPPTGYIVDTTNNTGRVYCTRCLVWREPGINYFHCGTCQRCCSYHDHHCTFFGRCIAGDKRLRTVFCYSRDGGNFKFFVTILGVGVMGYWTTVVSLMYALSLRYASKWVVPIGLVAMVCVHVTFGSRLPNAVCRTFRRLVVEIVECVRGCVQKFRG